MRRSVFFLLVLVGCGVRAPERPPPTPTSPATAPSTQAAASTAAAAPIARTQVDALLATWLGAQNGGRFEEYEALYAERFEGTRRSRSETRQFDRAGWLADRRRMFARPMRVEAVDVEVQTTPTVATVLFTQRWSSGRYSDEGPKRLVLVPRGDGLAIASEEMLSTRALVGVEARIVDGLFATYDAADGTYVVLGPARAQDASGAPRLASTAGPYLAVRDVSGSAPEAARRLVGETMQIVGDGRVCALAVSRLAVVSLVHPHFGTVAFWGGDEGQVTPASPAEIAREVVGMAETSWLVAVVPRTCGRSHAATLGAVPPTLFTASAPSDALRDQVLARLAAPDLAEDLRDTVREALSFQLERPPEAIDARLVDAAIARAIDVVVHTHGDTRIVAVRLALEGPCTGYGLAYLFDASGDGLVRVPFEGHHVRAVFDREGDGRAEAAVSDRFDDRRSVMRVGPTPTYHGELVISNFDCDC